jgi:hypothetical protein
LLFPQPHGPACWDCALVEIRAPDEFLAFCKSVQDNGPHYVPAWKEWAAVADDGRFYSHADLHQLKIELCDRNLYFKFGYLKIATPEASVR